MSTYLADINDVAYAGLLAKARDNDDVIVIKGRFLDGTYGIQTIGSAGTIVDIEFYCTMDVRRALQTCARTNLALGVGAGFTEAMDGVTKSMTAAIPTDFETNMNMGVNAYQQGAFKSGQAAARTPSVNVIVNGKLSIEGSVGENIARQAYTFILDQLSFDKVLSGSLA